MEKQTTRLTLSDTIYANIRKDITQHIIKPGEKINIKELAKRYGVSETPVKFALNRLISEKIIDNFPRQGMKVHSVTSEEVNDTFDTRLMLDLYYLKQIILTVSFNDTLKEEFRKNIDEQLKLVTNLSPDSPVEDYLRNYKLDCDFHELYLKCSGNQKIVEIFQYINPFLYSNFIFRRQSKVKDIGGVKEHQAILDAILNEDEVALKNALTAHIMNAKTAIGLILRVNKII